MLREDCVWMSHVVSLLQVRREGRNQLFDLPTQGSEAERRVRMARWRISSAVEKCLGIQSRRRVVLDKWVDVLAL